MATERSSSPAVESLILVIRGQKVMLDADLARLYGVSVKELKQAVRRNLVRFPADFMLVLEWHEVSALRSQTVTLEAGPSRKGRHSKYRPFAFTEQGVAMLSSVLKSKRAVRANIEIMRTFVRLRALAGQNVDLARRLDALESRYDRQFKVVFDAIRELMAPSVSAPKRRIGFVSGD